MKLSCSTVACKSYAYEGETDSDRDTERGDGKVLMEEEGKGQREAAGENGRSGREEISSMEEAAKALMLEEEDDEFEVYEDEEDMEEESRLSYTYENEGDDELAASIYDLKTSVDERDLEEEEGEGESGNEGDLEEAMDQIVGVLTEEEEGEEEEEEGADRERGNSNSMEEEEYVIDDDNIDYLDPSDWRSLQLLNEAGDPVLDEPAEDAELEVGDKYSFARDVLEEMSDPYLASSFLEDASEHYQRTSEQQAAIAILSQELRSGTSTKRKQRGAKKGGKKAAASDANADLLEEDELKEGESGEVEDQIHPSRVIGTSEWYPETSERCLYYHEQLREFAVKGEGDDAVVVLEEMRVAGILPGPKAYHATIHAYATQGNLVAAINVMRKAFEMMVPPPLESALVVTKMLMTQKDSRDMFYADSNEKEFFQKRLLNAWKWLGYDTNEIANETMVAILEQDHKNLDLVSSIFKERSEGLVKWHVNATLLHLIIRSLCEGSSDGKGEQRVAEILQFDLDPKKELGLVSQNHLSPLVHFPIERGDLSSALYQLKVVLISIANPYLDFKTGLIGLFNLLMDAYIRDAEEKGTFSELYEKWSALDRLREQHCVIRDGHWYRLALEVLLQAGPSVCESDRHSYTVLEHMDGAYQSDRVNANEPALVRHGASGSSQHTSGNSSIFSFRDSTLLERLCLFFSKQGVPASLLYTMHIASKSGLKGRVASAIDRSVNNENNLSVSTDWISAWRERFEPVDSSGKEARNVALRMLRADAATAKNVTIDDKGRVVEESTDGEEQSPLPIWSMSQVQLMAECVARGLSVSRYSLTADLCMRVYTARCFEEENENISHDSAGSNQGEDPEAIKEEQETGELEEEEGEEEGESMQSIIQKLLADEQEIENLQASFEDDSRPSSEDDVEDIIDLKNGISPLQTPAALALKIARACVSLGCTETPTREDLEHILEICVVYSDPLCAYDLAHYFGQKHVDIQKQASTVCIQLGRKDLADRMGKYEAEECTSV